jgi:hypothetical protein
LQDHVAGADLARPHRAADTLPCRSHRRSTLVSQICWPLRFPFLEGVPSLNPTAIDFGFWGHILLKSLDIPRCILFVSEFIYVAWYICKYISMPFVGSKSKQSKKSEPYSSSDDSTYYSDIDSEKMTL